MEKIRVLNKFIGFGEIKFGDYILFQEYISNNHDSKKYTITKPILVIYLGVFVCDQTIGFNYVKVINENNQYAQIEVSSHIEWDDYIDILGHWKKRPTWKQIIKKYRLQNTKSEILSNQFK